MTCGWNILHVGEATIGLKKYNGKREYWDKEIDKLIKNRRQANKLFRVWSKHPNCSPELLQVLWDDYLDKKKRVATKVKQNEFNRKIKVISENAAKATSNPRSYWNMLRKLNNSNDYPIRIRDPEDHNKVIDDPVVIKEKLTKYWSTLGGTQSKINEEQKERIKELESASPEADSFNCVIFNADYVQAAIMKLKNGKAIGPDNVPGEFLKFGGTQLQDAMLKLFCKIKTVETIPSDWYEGYVKPLFKEGNHEILSNYRGITISSVAYKVLVSIIERQTMTFLEDKNILGECQGAFRKNRRCEDQIYSLKGMCTIRKKNKKNTFLAFLDVSKAFDTLDRTQLFNHIWDKGIQGKAWRLVKMLYQKVDNKVVFGKFESDAYEVLNGVKQGCIMSPCLFNLAMADLERMLHQCNGIEIGDRTVHGLFYADDIVLMANTDQELLHMLQKAHEFAQLWGLRFNSKNPKYLSLARDSQIRNGP